MKYLSILIFIFLNLSADEKKESVTVGAGLYIQTQPYQDVESLLLPSPVIFFDNSIFYARWTRFGVYFLGEKQDNYAWAFSLTAMPRTYGYQSSDIENMKERENSWEGGISFSAKFKDSYIEIMALTDILDREDSYVLKTDIGYDFKISSFSFYPSISVIYQSPSFTNYYYGVKESETTLLRKSYSADSGYQVAIQTYISYPFTKNFSTLLNIKADRLSHEAISSPIVEDRYIYSGLLSLLYNFEY
ncbi:MAG: MipA/OmpV family protein [Campylobacterota bacterium]|nr:MipA/OmpV family protein [Campylobacterota bacterium]